MTLYELTYLHAYLSEQMVGLLSVYVGLSSAAVVGAYVAGNKLTYILSWGIVLLYTVPALSLVRTRLFFGQRLAALSQDIEEMAQREGVSLKYLETSDGVFTWGNEIAMVAYLSIWAAVIFFVFYAKSRLVD